MYLCCVAFWSFDNANLNYIGRKLTLTSFKRKWQNKISMKKGFAEFFGAGFLIILMGENKNS